MSNLSELLPAGAGAKSADFVASGTLGSGQTVVLKTDGTVEAVGETPAGLGTEATFDTATSLEGYFNSAYDSANNKIVIAGRVSAQTYKGYAYVGTISGTSITFGTPVQFTAGTQRADQTVAITYDVASGKVVIFWANIDNGTYGTAIVGTVSGTSISFGSPVVFDSSAVSFSSAYTAAATYHSGQDVCVLSYRNSAGTLSTIACSVSGTTPTFGSQVVIGGTAFQYIDNVYDASADRIVTSGSIAGANGTFMLSSCSGTTMTTTATDLYFNSGNVNYTALAYDSVNEKTVVFYNDTSNSYKGSACVATISAAGASFGTEVVFQSSGSSEWISAAYDASAQKIVVASSSSANSDSGQIYVGTVSGTDISFSGQLAFNGTSTTIRIRATYAEAEQQTCISYVDYGNSQRGTAIMYSNISTNSADFIGITDQAIADTATGAVIVQGGVNSSNAGASIPLEYSPSSGVDFDASGPTLSISSVFDTNSDKVVVFYSDYGNGQYGTAVVGTISSGVISFGTPVVFNSADISSTAAAFDSSANKSVIAYRDGGASNQGKAIVGTVSGTSISFGAEATFNAASTTNIGSTFDSTANKVVIAFRDDGNSDYGTAIVGTVSGTSVSFGSETVFETTQTSYHSLAYDPDENKTVLNYRHDGGSGYGKSRVGTVSGTSISFGTAVTFNAASTSFVSSVYDTAQNKTVIAYANANAGTGIVGTVSGTSISFGTPAVFLATSTGNITTAFDSTANKVVVAYSESVTTFDGFSSVGTVSGTDISFAAGTNFTGDTSYSDSAVTYDSTANKMVFSFRNGTAGTAVVGTLSGGAFTPNTDYYVQTDGSLSTTTSTVPAGRALSTTSILLEG
jgi:hypothetical protein